MNRLANTGSMAVAVVVVWVGVALAQTDLYSCAGSPSDAPVVGLTLCDAAPTDALTRRAETDNLQVRAGVLVVEVEDGGISAAAGLQGGDVLYRVGGVDVSDPSAAIQAFSAVGRTSDTIVNFLRGGRPYRVKLRRE